MCTSLRKSHEGSPQNLKFLFRWLSPSRKPCRSSRQRRRLRPEIRSPNFEARNKREISITKVSSLGFRVSNFRSHPALRLYSAKMAVAQAVSDYARARDAEAAGPGNLTDFFAARSRRAPLARPLRFEVSTSRSACQIWRRAPLLPDRHAGYNRLPRRELG